MITIVSKYWEYFIDGGWAYWRRDNSWLDKNRIAVLIWLVRTVPRFRRCHITRQFEIANRYYKRRYVAPEFKQEIFEYMNGDSNEERTVLLVSPENDYRYEWLEIALMRNRIPCQIIYLPRIIFHQHTAFFMKSFFEGSSTSLDPKKIARNYKQFQHKKAKLHRHLATILRTIIEQYKPDAFISASIADLRWLETIHIARKLGVRWVVTEREGVIPPIVRNKNVEVVRRRFEPECDLICTSNEEHAAYWESIGVSGGKIVIIGDLKSDIWANNNCWPTRREIHTSLSDGKILILYFAFGTYLNERLFQNEKRDWTQLQKEHYEVLKAIAHEFGDQIQLVIKEGHPADLSTYFTIGHFDETMDNVFVLDLSYQALDLIINADIIIGFQTTAMIESMFTDKPIIFPAWGDLYSDIADDLLPLHRSGAATRVHSKEELHEKLVSFVNNPESLAVNTEMIMNRIKFRERYYYQPDGNVGLRTYQAIQDMLKDRSKNNN